MLDLLFLLALSCRVVSHEEPCPSALEKSINMNKQKFNAIRALNLPLGHYAITGSGPLGIRNLRPINDIDLVFSEELWQKLSATYPVVFKGGNQVMVVEEGKIEVYGSWTYRASPGPTIQEIIDEAEIIDGLPFMSIPHTIFCKRDLGREKDFKDIALLEAWLNTRSISK